MYIYTYVYIYIYIGLLRAVRGHGEGQGRLPLRLLAVRVLLSLSLPFSATAAAAPTVSFHNFKSQSFKLSVSNPKSKYVAYLSVLSQISNCQGLGCKNKHENLKTDRMVPILFITFHL